MAEWLKQRFAKPSQFFASWVRIPFFPVRSFMSYKKIRYNYFNHLLQKSFLLKEKKEKYFFLFHIPENYSEEQKVLFVKNLSKKGFIVKTIKVSYLKRIFKLKSVDSSFLDLIQGSLLVGTFYNTGKNISKAFKQELLMPLAILNEEGFVYSSSFVKKLDSLTLPVVGLNLFNVFLLNQIRLIYLLERHKENKSV